MTNNKPFAYFKQAVKNSQKTNTVKMIMLQNTFRPLALCLKGIGVR